MKRKKHARPNVNVRPSRRSPILSAAPFAASLSLLAMLVFPPGTGAQEQDNQTPDNQADMQSLEPAGDDTSPQGDKQPTTAEMVTDYLRQDIFVSPGVGLKKVKIGMPFDQVAKAWGPPTSKGGTVDNQWTYQVGNNTKITLVGDNEVRVMKIAGGFNTPYVTTEGAAFGMPQYQLATIYGSAKEVAGKIMYNDRGIGFVMDDGQVSEMEVFAPRK